MYNKIQDLLTFVHDSSIDQLQPCSSLEVMENENEHKHKHKHKSNQMQDENKRKKLQLKHTHDNSNGNSNESFKSVYLTHRDYSQILESQNYETMKQQLIKAIGSDSLLEQCAAAKWFSPIAEQYFYRKRDIDSQRERQEGDGKVYPPEYVPVIQIKCQDLFNHQLLARFFRLIGQGKCPRLQIWLSYTLVILSAHYHFNELFMDSQLIPHFVELFASSCRMNTKSQKNIIRTIDNMLQNSYSVFQSKMLSTGIFQAILSYAHKYNCRQLIQKISLASAKYSQMYMLSQGKDRALLCTIICEYLTSGIVDNLNNAQDYTWALIRLTSEHNEKVIAIVERYNIWDWAIKHVVDTQGSNLDMLHIIKNFINYQACLSDIRIADFMSIIPYFFRKEEVSRQRICTILSDFVFEEIKHKEALLQNPRVISLLVLTIRNDQHHQLQLAIMIIGRLCIHDDYHSKNAEKAYRMVLDHDIPMCLAYKLTAAQEMDSADLVLRIIETLDAILNLGAQFEGKPNNKIITEFKNVSGQKALSLWYGHEMGQIGARASELAAKYFDVNN